MHKRNASQNHRDGVTMFDDGDCGERRNLSFPASYPQARSTLSPADISPTFDFYFLKPRSGANGRTKHSAISDRVILNVLPVSAERKIRTEFQTPRDGWR